MRIIAGSLKGRRLQGPKGDALRPTSDRLRETLFNVLGPTVKGARVLDAYAGTGAVGLEALSRGAARVTFIERDPAAIQVITANVAHCRVETSCIIIRGDFLRSRGTGDYDVVFLDPPYDIDDLATVVTMAAAQVAPDGRVVLEHSRRRDSPAEVRGLSRARVLAAGDSALAFYVAPATRGSD